VGRVLLLGARTAPDKLADRRLAEIAAGPLDWGLVVDRAGGEGVVPLVHWNLRRLDLLHHLPSEAQRRLTAGARRAWARGAVLAARWGEATRALRDAGVDALTLKGIALAHTVYPEPGLRPMADIDLLVRPSDRLRAIEILGRHDYRTPGREAERLGESRCFAELVRDGVLLDLHWDIARYLRFEGVVRVDHEGLWRRARPLVLAEGRSQALCPEDTLLHLVVHLTLGSDFARVLWYADIDAVIRRYAAELDWDRVVDEARCWRIGALLDWTLGVVTASFGTPLPAGLVERLAPGRLRRAAVLACIDSSWPPSLGSSLSEARIYPAQTLLMDRGVDVLRVLAWTFFPSDTWLRLHYSIDAPWQVPLYRLLHPVRVCWRLARRLR
jgi:putative nucleotidyltransferase-like protein